MDNPEKTQHEAEQPDTPVPVPSETIKAQTISTEQPFTPDITVQPVQKPPKKHRKFLKIILFALAFVVVISGTAFACWNLGYNAGTDDEHSYMRNCELSCATIQKPVIYLYPTTPTKANVQVDYPAGFTKTIPVYKPPSGWQVLAQPSGDLTNFADDKHYPYLFWEGNDPGIDYDMNSGFVVAGPQTESFLHTKLSEIGLSASEANEFIEYWLPRMSRNNYNLIHFAGSEYTDYAKLNITPHPDSLLRVMMVFKPLNTPTMIKPQTFPAFHRQGFTVVEWGGTQISR